MCIIFFFWFSIHAVAPNVYSPLPVSLYGQAVSNWDKENFNRFVTERNADVDVAWRAWCKEFRKKHRNVADPEPPADPNDGVYDKNNLPMHPFQYNGDVLNDDDDADESAQVETGRVDSDDDEMDLLNQTCV